MALFYISLFFPGNNSQLNDFVIIFVSSFIQARSNSGVAYNFDFALGFSGVIGIHCFSIVCSQFKAFSKEVIEELAIGANVIAAVNFLCYISSIS